jgi:hypothetical protein
MPITPNVVAGDYRILVSRSNQRPLANLYDFSLQASIPRFNLPLQPDDLSVMVDLQEIFNGVYDRASYDLRIHYQQLPPPPALSEANWQWLTKQFRKT